MKTIQEIVESSATAMIDPERVEIRIPTDFQMPPGGLHIRWPDHALEQEARLYDYKWYAALAYIRANRLNYNVIEGPNDRFGLIASGKAYNDTRQALIDLGLDDDDLPPAGHPPAQGRRGLAAGSAGHARIRQGPAGDPGGRGKAPGHRIPAEGRALQLAPRRAAQRGRQVRRGRGRHVSGGEWSMPNPTAHTLLRANADLSPALIARAIAQRLKKTGRRRRPGRAHRRPAGHPRGQGALDAGAARSTADRAAVVLLGLPAQHQSTVVPEGSRAMAGIGCHFMATWMDRSTIGFTQMGGEGVPWVGQQPFTTEQHVFANLGDGTYFHSGLLAIRQSIAAGVNITYKILYNDAVAMTGGQQVGERPEGHSVMQIAHSLHGRRRDQDGHRHRRAGEVRRRASCRRRRASAPPRRAGSHPARVPRDQGHHGHHLRPDLRHREAPPPQARHRWSIRPCAWSSTSWCAKAAATAASRAIACRSSRWKPSSAASARSTRAPATRTRAASRAFARASSPSRADS